MKPTPEDIIHLFHEKGSQLYGSEAVSQLEHALQCATLAETEGKSKELITACLLHDVGHLIHNLGENPATRGIDDHHEHRAIPLLRQLFGPGVTEPIRLHVAAKRYLCSINTEYWESLSPASKRSLELQGGIFSPQEADAFINQPHAQDAVQLRIYDDLAKLPNFQTPNLNHFTQYLTTALK
ncbi:MAG: HD domain-containing protein [Goleter apudmare HA4340-LM2]|jgi:phosphonate degradation associated HDIG domain protein|nr:HD domain-containing protein [Goleter apudmare HA4340-LM2]